MVVVDAVGSQSTHPRMHGTIGPVRFSCPSRFLRHRAGMCASAYVHAQVSLLPLLPLIMDVMVLHGGVADVMTQALRFIANMANERETRVRQVAQSPQHVIPCA
jgi:hypothetical protein